MNPIKNLLVSIALLTSMVGCQLFEPDPPAPPPAPAPPPGLSISVEPLLVPAGGSVVVRWSAIGADSVRIDPGNLSGLPVEGQQVFHVERATTFVLTAVFSGRAHQTSARVGISR